MARPDRSTATQKEAEGHEIEVRWALPSASARDQLLSTHWTTPPELSVTAQKLVEGHETPVGVGPSVVAEV